MIYAVAAYQPQVALGIGHTVGDGAQRVGCGIGALLFAVGIATGDGAVAVNGPKGTEAVGILIGVACDECLSTPVFLCKKGHLGKLAGAHVKLKEAFIYHAAYVARWQHEDVAEAVVGHIAAIAHRRFEECKLLSVKAAQAIPRGYPYKALMVLDYLGDVRRRQTAVFVILGNPAFRRCPQQQAPHSSDR